MILPTLLVCFATLGIPLDEDPPRPSGMPGTEVTNALARVRVICDESYNEQVIGYAGSIKVLEDNCYGYSLSGSAEEELYQSVDAHAKGSGYRSVVIGGSIGWIPNPAYVQQHGTWPTTSLSGAHIVNVRGVTNYPGESASSSASSAGLTKSGSTGGVNGFYAELGGGPVVIQYSTIALPDPDDPDAPDIEMPFYSTSLSLQAHILPG
jgi:hypothetical protein